MDCLAYLVGKKKVGFLQCWTSKTYILYIYIWDAQTALNFIKENWGNNKKIIDKGFSLKLRMLIALATAARAIEIYHLNILKI